MHQMIRDYNARAIVKWCSLLDDSPSKIENFLNRMEAPPLVYKHPKALTVMKKPCHPFIKRPKKDTDGMIPPGEAERRNFSPRISSPPPFF